MRRLVIILVIPALSLAAAAGRPAGPALLPTERHAEVTPVRSGCTYVGGGNINVRQPGPDTILVTLTGAVVATGHPCGSAAVMDFDLEQAFKVVGGPGKLSLEVEAVGVLRGGRIAAAAQGGCASVLIGGMVIVGTAVPDRSVGGGENLTVADRVAPEDVPVNAGPHLLHAHWRLTASHPKGLRGKAASAEFAPEPALDPLWVGGPRDPFHGIAKKDFGLQVTLRVSPTTTPEAAWAGRRP
jgi:hypothetical protein